jgi:three-Cys-motif partner protein
MKFDEIGYWSEIKLDIVKDYGAAYSKILDKQRGLEHVYIDAFAGAGKHISRTTGEFVLGSPLNALAIEPRFSEYHFVDLDAEKLDCIADALADDDDAELHLGDCNDVLVNRLFPSFRYEDYRRALCLLDPYGLTLNWQVMETAGQLRTVEIFLNFPVMDMNRNALWQNPDGVTEEDRRRMTSFWGDESWREVAYSKQGNLFGEDDLVKTGGNHEIAEAFRERLRRVAGFEFVPEPMPMRNSRGATVYYLFFAGPNAVGSKIIEAIFRKYRTRGAR